jgi:hypothetical protein
VSDVNGSPPSGLRQFFWNCLPEGNRGRG